MRCHLRGNWNTIRLSVLIVTTLLFAATQAHGATCTSTAAGGNWSAGGSWLAGCGGGGPVAGDTVNIATTGAGLVTVDVATAAVASVTVNSGARLTVAQTLNITNSAASFLTVAGTMNIGNSNTARTINVSGDITVSGTMAVPTTSNANHLLNTGGNIVNTGTINFSSDANSLCDITFNKNGNQSVSGAGSYTFDNIVLNMGTSKANILDMQSPFTAPAGFLTITNGTYKHSTTSNITPWSAATTIPATGGFWLNGAATVSTGAFSVSLNGGTLRISNGTMNIGTANSNFLRLLNSAATSLLMEGGVLNASGGITSAAVGDAGSFTQTGGMIALATVLGGTGETFMLGSATTFTMSAGSLVLQTANNAADDLNIRSGTSIVTGGTVQLGNAALTGTNNFLITNTAGGSLNIWNLVLYTTGGPTTQIGTITNVLNDLAIQTGATLLDNNLTTAFPINVGAGNNAGNWTNNGTFTATTGTVTLTGITNSVIAGTSANTFFNLTVNKTAPASGVTITNATNHTVSNLLTLTSGTVTTGSNTLITAANCNVPSVARTSGWVNGNLQKRIPAGASACTFEVGDAGYYTPVATNFPATTTTGNLTARTTTPDHPNIAASALHPALTANRWWTLTNGGVGGLGTGYSATFNFVAADLDPGTDPANNFEVQRYAGAAWNNTTLGVRTATSTQAIGLTAFGDFAAGERIVPLYAAQGFNVYDHCTTGCGINGFIKTKIAGTAFGSASGQLDIVAINAAGTAIETSFKGYVKTELVDATSGGGACSSMSPIQMLSPDTRFLATDAGRDQNIDFTENNSWPNVKVRITYPRSGVAPVTIACSVDAFAIRPDRLVINATQDANWSSAGTARNLNNTGATGGVVHKAGQPFTIIATAQNALANTTTNYAGSPTGSVSACTAAGTACTASFGSMTPGTWSAASGVVTTTTANYSEVGAFGLQLQDTTFSNVDLADGSTAAQRTIPLSAKVDVGRFVPDHFVIAASNTPQYKTFNTGDASCAGAAPYRTFTYIGQSFGWVTSPQALITAQNAANTTTANYKAALWKLAAADVNENYGSVPASLNASSQGTPGIVSNNNGTGSSTSAATGTFLYTRTAPQVPFNANISLTVNVQDASENTAGQGIIGTTTPAVFNGGGTGIGFDGGGASNGQEFRYGRLRISNGYGSELLPLAVPVVAQFWNGTSYLTNTADNCTSLAASNFALAAVPGGGTITTSIVGGGLVAAGTGRIALTKPTGFTLKGSVDINPAGSISAFLPGSAGRETFGVYKTRPLIYMREMH